MVERVRLELTAVRLKRYVCSHYTTISYPSIPACSFL
ncbi:hypothetical protein vBPaerPsIn_193c [Pseudomonas phage vB_Paer_PsIn]|uniref:Uncharacterized protein n=1 Tax=Pseudomonas phage vB_Paer_PsIn TaxID=2924907 RepID=A0AAE9GN23_9CAUD|nr:hypothetical protein QE348_gp196 [Pseudomonas phage vB_Paer_PsIn]UOL48221.1 hypothetical protein vBPaerPsIn_193c [Pseudomonas phage vB_Paer_PsIn]